MSSDGQQDLDQLQTRMSAVRGQLSHDVDDFVDSTKKMVDWKSYVTSYPIGSTIAAIVTGYMLIPAKKRIVSPDADELAKLAKRNKLVVQINPNPQRKSSLTGTLFGLASSMVVRGVTSYLGQQAGKLSGAMAANQAHDQEAVNS